MWRVFNSITRGARICRPSPCCSQEPADETNCNLYNNDHQSSLLSCFGIPCRHLSSSSSSENSKNNLTISICRVSCRLCNKIVKCCGGDEKAHDRRKLVWIWAIPCDIYPHAQIRWNHREDKENSHFDWNQFYRDQHSLLNALGWGSATALAWGLCRELGNYGYLNQKNTNRRTEGQDDTVQIYNAAASLNTKEDKNKKRGPGDVENVTKSSYSYIPQYSLLHHNDKACFQPNLFNPEVNKSFYASLFTNAVDNLLTERAERGKNKETLRSEPLIASELDIYHLDDTKPKIESDKEELERLKGVRRSHDSGYSEEVQETSGTFLSSQDICSVSTQNADEVSAETSLSEPHDLESLPAASKSPQHSFFDNLHQHGFELSSNDLVQTEISAKIKVREEVLIEDCNSYDSFQNDTVQSSENSVSETKTSCSKLNSFAASIDDFSDGLKEILEAGRKDLNDFNTQFMGVLEGDIGRSVSKEEPSLAIAYFRTGALLGDASSTFNLALCYHLARGVDQDLKMARELYEAASLAGHGWATYNLAVLLFNEQGGPADPERAQELLKTAGEMGVHEAQVALKQRQEIQTKEERDVSRSKNQERKQCTNYHSEPVLSTVLSSIWSSSYSTSDLDFMDDSPDLQLQDLPSMSMNSTEKPKFYLE